VYERYLELPWEWRFETDDTEMAPALMRLRTLYLARGDTRRATTMRSRLAALWNGGDAETQRLIADASNDRGYTNRKR
jgi:hypothetical protein